MIALVTGGNRGIGLEVCRQLAEKGYKVVLGSRDLSKGHLAAQDVPGEVTVKQLDVTSEANVRDVVSYLESEHGLLDVLVNNAATDYSALVVRDYSHHPKTHVCDIHFTTEFVGDQMIPAI